MCIQALDTYSVNEYLQCPSVRPGSVNPDSVNPDSESSVNRFRLYRNSVCESCVDGEICSSWRQEDPRKKDLSSQIDAKKSQGPA